MLEIIFQNDHFCAVVKPAEWLSVPSRTGAADPRPVVGIQLEKDLRKRVWPCHRLDEDVSGILLFALNAAAHKAANGWFEHHQVIKTYVALSEPTGTLPKMNEIQNWKCKLMRGKRRAYEADFGKESHTRAWFVGKGRYQDLEIAIWNLQPLTGRSHQLRYEMSRHGWSILGDELYGSTKKISTAGIALRAISLDFEKCPGKETFGVPKQLLAESFESLTLNE